jgi:signal peptidase I
MYEQTVGSMEPTFHSGDIVLMDRVSFRFGHPIKRGDIISFRVPKLFSVDAMKRVIGLPGDRIRVRTGIGVYVNGELLDESHYVKELPRYQLNLLGDIKGIVDRNGKNINYAPYSDSEMAQQPIVVPEGHLFVLGDNRNNSLDSHIFGFIDRKIVKERFWKYLWRHQKPKAAPQQQNLHCSFCGINHLEVPTLITGKSANICSRCIPANETALREAMKHRLYSGNKIRCAFCQNSVIEEMTIGNSNKICLLCLRTSQDVVDGGKTKSPGTIRCSFCKTPSEEVTWMLAALSGQYICDQCVDNPDKLPNEERGESQADTEQCSFCKETAKKPSIEKTPTICRNCLNIATQNLDQRTRKGAPKLTPMARTKRIEELTAALDQIGSDAAALRERAGLYFDALAYDKALDDADRVLVLQTDSAETYALRAEICIRLGLLTQALKDYSTALDLDHDSAWYYRQRAALFSALDRYDSAIEDLGKAIALAPELDDAYASRAYDYIKTQQYAEAIADCNRAISLNANYAVAYNNRARALYLTGKYEDALQDIEKAIALDSLQYAVFFYNRGAIQKSLGKDEQALADFNMALKMDPQLGKAANDCADLEKQLAGQNRNQGRC